MVTSSLGLWTFPLILIPRLTRDEASETRSSIFQTISVRDNNRATGRHAPEWSGYLCSYFFPNLGLRHDVGFREAQEFRLAHSHAYKVQTLGSLIARLCVYVCVCVHMCLRERETEREREMIAGSEAMQHHGLLS